MEQEGKKIKEKEGFALFLIISLEIILLYLCHSVK